MSVIPDGEKLLRYANPKAFPEGQLEIPIGVFNDPELSCDWYKYVVDPQKSFHITEGKTVIIEITVCDEIRNPRNPRRSGEIVEDWKQEIIHKPITEKEDPIHGANYAHSLIKGKKKAAVTSAIQKNSRRLE